VTSTTTLRALTVIQRAGLSDAGPLELAPSANEVWFAGPYVIRISSEPGSNRLHYEAAVAAALPAEVPYPEIVTMGRATFGEWMVLRRSAGTVLSRAWLAMDEDERHEAVRQLGTALEHLHGAPPPEAVPPFSGDLECPHQLPVPRLLELLDRCARLPHVDAGVIEAARERVVSLAPSLEGSDDGLVHGDLHFENVIWDGSRVAALLDLEWARRAPRDLDLDVFLRFCADPALHVTEDYGHLTTRSDYRGVPGWLREAYPRLFAHPRLDDRLVVFGLSYDVRHLLLNPPSTPADRLPTHHPYLRVKRWVDGRSHLSWMHW
jgi:hygromycin-B 7''-O-kinase